MRSVTFKFLRVQQADSLVKVGTVLVGIHVRDKLEQRRLWECIFP